MSTINVCQKKQSERRMKRKAALNQLKDLGQALFVAMALMSVYGAIDYLERAI